MRIRKSTLGRLACKAQRLNLSWYMFEGDGLDGGDAEIPLSSDTCSSPYAQRIAIRNFPTKDRILAVLAEILHTDAPFDVYSDGSGAYVPPVPEEAGVDDCTLHLLSTLAGEILHDLHTDQIIWIDWYDPQAEDSPYTLVFRMKEVEEAYHGRKSG